MFKWFVLSGALLVLAIQNRLLKDNLAVTERYNKQLISKEWDAQAQEHLNLLAELIDHFDGRPNRWPVLGEISSNFGYRVDPFTGNQAMHCGLDIVAPHGTPIHAPAPGRVVFVGDGGPLGNLVVIEHQHNLRSGYGHLSEYHVREGEWVTRGQKIAEVGSTGRSTGSHLHYSIQRDGVHQDPTEYLE
jgi:murein DD-endopeptidase MepM/ murein hydrolase activator NlpD